MKFIRKKFGLLCLLSSVMLIQGCLSVARISDFPKKSTLIDFDKYSSEFVKQKQPLWTLETSNEYYFERNQIIKRDTIFNLISKALIDNGYRIFFMDNENQYVIGKRGLRANEWNAKTGVYFKLDMPNKKTQIYIDTRITQDITGGWKNNRAKKIGLVLEKLIDDINE